MASDSCIIIDMVTLPWGSNMLKKVNLRIIISSFVLLFLPFAIGCTEDQRTPEIVKEEHSTQDSKEEAYSKPEVTKKDNETQEALMEDFITPDDLSGEIDYSTPEATIKTLYKSYSRQEQEIGSRRKINSYCFYPKSTNTTGWLDDFWLEYRIKEISKTKKAGQKTRRGILIDENSVEIIVEAKTNNPEKGNPVANLWYLLKEIDNEWKIIDKTHIPDENYSSKHVFETAYVYAQEPASCNPSIKLEKPEGAYGSPSVPNVDTTTEEYKKRLSQISTEEDSSDRMYELAYIAYSNNDFDVADKYFLKSLEVDNYTVPFYKTHIHTFLGWIDEKNGRLLEAKEHFKIRGDKYYLHMIQAKIYREEGNLELAEHEYLLAQSVNLYEMHNLTPYIDIAEMYLSFENYEKAKLNTEKYLKCVEYMKKYPILTSKGYGISSSEINKARELLKRIENRGVVEEKQIVQGDTSSKPSGIDCTFSSETSNAAAEWFGGDGRPGFGPRNVGVGQSVTFINDCYIRTVGFRFINGFRNSTDARSKANGGSLILNVRESDGTIIGTRNASVSDNFNGGWVDFDVNMRFEAKKKYIFTAHLHNGINLKFYALAKASLEDTIPNGKGYRGEIKKLNGDLQDWANWSKSPLRDNSIRITGDIAR
jgi:tetratricopeptide (TPR) repeat protein